MHFFNIFVESQENFSRRLTAQHFTRSLATHRPLFRPLEKRVHLFFHPSPSSVPIIWETERLVLWLPSSPTTRSNLRHTLGTHSHTTPPPSPLHLHTCRRTSSPHQSLRLQLCTVCSPNPGFHVRCSAVFATVQHMPYSMLLPFVHTCMYCTAVCCGCPPPLPLRSGILATSTLCRCCTVRGTCAVCTVLLTNTLSDELDISKNIPLF